MIIGVCRARTCLGDEGDDVEGVESDYVSERPTTVSFQLLFAGYPSLYGFITVQLHLCSLAMNAPNRHELFVLEDGEKGVQVIEDTKIPNAATIKIIKQDHTLANMIRAQLLATPSILFAGYKVPHPLEPYFILKIQTDGSVTPTEALEQAGNQLLKMLSDLQAKFKTEFSYKDVEGADGLPEDAYGTLPGGVGTTSAWGANVRDYADY